MRKAISAWREIVGPARVIIGGEASRQADQATFAGTPRPMAILQPGDSGEVAACLRVAERYRLPVHPVSTGRNWGYGSMVPTSDRCVVLSLARLDRILDYSEEFAYVTVEPGVTFRRLAEYLCERGSHLLPPLTGTSPDASLIGNVLERGIGKGPYTDMVSRSCAYEVVLPSGETIHTGFAALPASQVASLRAAGPGPALEGLFVQSNLGVVTRMTFWLDPAPTWRQLLVVPIRDGPALASVLDALRELLLRNGNALEVHLLNDYRFLAQSRQFPYAEFNGTTALPGTWVAAHVRHSLDGRWIGGVTLWADSAQELAFRRQQVTTRLKRLVGTISETEPKPGGEASTSYDGLRCAYWRKRRPMPADPHPDRDRCGVLWLTPVLPMQGAVVAEVTGQIERIMPEYGFEPTIALRVAGGRALQAIVGLLYDREDAGADERAAACHATLRAMLDGQGLYPYRLSLYDALSPPPLAGANGELLRSLKALLDPYGVLAPSRYIR